MEKIRILFLCANPLSTTRVTLDEEMHAIQQRLRQSGAGDLFELQAEWAVRASELPAAIMRAKPRIVHFSGHGTHTGELLLVGSHPSQAAPVAPETLKKLFAILGRDIFCVLLNACYSDLQANALVDVIPCAVGMGRAVTDEGAIAFAAGFYEALAFGQSLQTAFELGRTSIELAQHQSQSLIPQLRANARISPAHYFLLPIKGSDDAEGTPNAYKQAHDGAESLLPAAPHRVRMIQEATCLPGHTLSFPRAEDHLVETIKGLPFIIGLPKGSFTNPWLQLDKFSIKGPLIHNKDTLFFHVTDNSSKNAFQCVLELNSSGLLRLTEYVDVSRTDEGPLLNIQHLAVRVGIFLIFAIRLCRRFPITSMDSLKVRCLLREIAGTYCEVGDWGVMNVRFGIEASVEWVKSPLGLMTAETEQVSLAGGNDGLTNIARLTSKLLRELTYEFRATNAERAGIVRPNEQQVSEVLGRMYERYV